MAMSCCDWIGELGLPRDPDQYGVARRRLAALPANTTEALQKAAAGYGGPGAAGVGSASVLHQHFGTYIVCCERGDVRPLPDRVIAYGDGQRVVHRLDPPHVPRAEVIDELYDAIVAGQAPVHDGRWSKATLEVCLALLRSAQTGQDVALAHQVGLPSGW